MSATDSFHARLQAELEERHKFIDGLIEEAEQTGRDLATHELERIAKERDRIKELDKQASSVQEVIKLGVESRNRHREIVKQYEVARNGDNGHPQVEYRSVGEYLIDRWRSGLGSEDAALRLDLYHRAAAHQTTADNAGLIPAPIIGPGGNFIDANLVVVSQLGTR